MSTLENSREREEFVEYNHRGQEDEAHSQSSVEDAGNAIDEIREIFMPKETGVTVAPNKQLVTSPSEEYFTPSKKVNIKSKYNFTSGCPSRIENRGEAVKELPFKQSITTGHQMTKALGIGGNERSNFILVKSPDADGNYSATKEISKALVICTYKNNIIHQSLTEIFSTIC